MAECMEEGVSLGNVQKYVRSSVETFLADPPDSEFQAGFLSALLAIAKEALGQPMDITPFAEAQELRQIT